MSEYKSKTICVDIDGTLAEYSGWQGIYHIGKPMEGAQEFMTRLAATYDRVLIHTTRTNLDLNRRSIPYAVLERMCDAELIEYLADVVRSWLRAHDIPYSDIWTGQGKPICVAFVDDRAIRMGDHESTVESYQKCLEQLARWT